MLICALCVTLAVPHFRQVKNHLRRLRIWSKTALSHCTWKPIMLRTISSLLGSLAVCGEWWVWVRILPLATRPCSVRRVWEVTFHPLSPAVVSHRESFPTNPARFHIARTLLMSQLRPAMHMNCTGSTKKYEMRTFHRRFQMV